MRTALVLLILMAVPAAMAQPSLFSPTPASLALTAEQDVRLDRLRSEPGVATVDVVLADVAPLGARGSVEVALPGGSRVVLNAVAFEQRAQDDASWTGQGAEASTAVLVARRGWVTGSIWHDGAVYEVRPLGGGLHALYRLNTSVFRDHDDGSLPEGRGDQPDTSGSSDADGASPTIDVLVAYTSDVAAAYADPVAFAQAAVDASNTASDNSAVQPRLRLVHAYETGTTSSGSTATDLERMQRTSDSFFDEVHAVRNEYGADLVALLGPPSTVYGSCGRGYINANAAYAFTITAHNCAVGNLTFAHELGHNMGLRHNPEVDDSTTPFPYGHGKTQDPIPGESSWRTVMAYSTCSASPCTRLPQWSNPDVTVRGSVSGDRDLRDNARVIDVRGEMVAAFRAAVVPPPGVSTLVDDPAGYRYLGAPSAGLTVDDLAAQNLVRGVPGYYPGAPAANLWTAYDATTSTWVASSGAGEVLEPGRAFRWLMYDRVSGNPAVSQGVELPFTLSTGLPANTADVSVTLQTDGDRFNYLANPFGTTLDLTGILSWPGGGNIVPTIWAYNPTTRRWDPNPTSVGPWEGFRVRSRPTAAAPRVITIPASAALAPGADGASDPVVARAAEASTEAPVTEVTLTSIAPNPSSGGARVSFAVPEAGPVRVTVVDVRGREVATLVDQPLNAGQHHARLSGSLAAGVYVVRLEAAGAVVTRTAAVVR